MNKADFFKKNDEKFLPLGFEKDETDPMFFYVKSLVSEEEIEDYKFYETYDKALEVGLHIASETVA